MQLKQSFFARNTLEVARDLLGTRLVKVEEGKRISGFIVETEAYCGEDDQGCHCRAGRTERTSVMYGPPGHSYVYFVYGMHWLLNFVTEREEYPGAVLIRAIIPEEGQEIIAARRDGIPPAQWTNGPAKLCQALGIDGGLNNYNICAPHAPLFVEQGEKIPDERVQTTARVGLNTVPEPWKSIPWRFVVENLRELDK
ncbi:MAG: putative 3-methyladenine DNA glycosylase [Chloroflexi bacterium]|nr:putative 3-methyladenine DNA glycosylase [Chloroflexota bacterium]